MGTQTFTAAGKHWWSPWHETRRTFSTKTEMNAWVEEMNRLNRVARRLFRAPDPGSMLEKMSYFEREVFVKMLQNDRKALKQHSILQYRCKAHGCLIAALVSVPGGTLWVYRENVRTEVLELSREEECSFFDGNPVGMATAEWVSDHADEDGNGQFVAPFVPNDLADYLDAMAGGIIDANDGLKLESDLTWHFQCNPMPIASCRHASTVNDVEKLLRDVVSVRGKSKNVIYL